MEDDAETVFHPASRERSEVIPLVKVTAAIARSKTAAASLNLKCFSESSTFWTGFRFGVLFFAVRPILNHRKDKTQTEQCNNHKARYKADYCTVFERLEVFEVMKVPENKTGDKSQNRKEERKN